ncbi:hypothetical protein BKE38_25015 [Pseudoroseomonas deserti]|uniref:Transglycosylase SLT domain-containing protein n=1 Tax=Teichococcus deserti TaxID=1817963 RepID=A0A1V2GW29_9PROT|nr:lytic transglycosylase domain-containing protein [Pseudoroseomonas deserti]ONG46704.1 hypothetical protein BKE38_25015 [Pseudoroseomonas deserti]
MPLPVGISEGVNKALDPAQDRMGAAAGAAAALPRSEQLGRFRVDSQVAGALRNAAKATGLGFNVLAAKAAMESGFRADAQASTSSARGLFQFIDQTWLGVVQAHGAEHGLGNEAAAISRSGSRLIVNDPAMRTRILALRDDPAISARLGAEHLKDLSDALRPALGGRAPDPTELYLGHFLGLRGATELLRAAASDPARAASDILPEAARANPAIFRGADGNPLSVQQLMDRLRARVGQIYASLGMAAPSGPVELAPGAAVAVMASQPAAPVASEEPLWWGRGNPARILHPSEQAMASSLVEVFSRMNRAATQRGRDDAPGELPGRVLEALREQATTLPETSIDPLAEARRAYRPVEI